MIPNTNTYTAQDDFSFGEETSRTYKLHIEQNRIYSHVDELEAVKQAVYLILNIERYEWAIYSWDYGIELADLFEQPIPYVIAELERRIKEALMQDDRILNVHSFKFDYKKHIVHCTFTVSTIFGDIEASKEVTV